MLPGGGVALLDCRTVLRERLSQAEDTHERVAYRILIGALEAPLRTLVKNAGYDPAEVLGEIVHLAPGHGIDLRTGDFVDMAVAGTWDGTAVQKAAVRSAISTAALALTTDVLIQRANPEPTLEP